MTNRRILVSVAFVSFATLAGLAACSEPGEEPLAAAEAHTSHVKSPNNPETSRWIAELRQATVAYKDFHSAARQEDYPDPVLDCLDLPDKSAAMGLHFADMSRMGDTRLDALAPELLVYEPQKNGKLQLVAVEYLIPFTAWPYDPNNAPVFMGMEMHPNHGLGVWVLHAWIWKNNPDGMFEDFNPKVTCAYADLAS